VNLRPRFSDAIVHSPQPAAPCFLDMCIIAHRKLKMSPMMLLKMVPLHIHCTPQPQDHVQDKCHHGNEHHILQQIQKQGGQPRSRSLKQAGDIMPGETKGDHVAFFSLPKSFQQIAFPKQSLQSTFPLAVLPMISMNLSPHSWQSSEG
jgi:hypothetical protein